MQKIISLFKRDYEGNRQVYNEVVPGAEWVVNGEGVPTVKIDGSCCKIEDGRLFKRYDAKSGKKPPEGFVPAQDPDPITGHWPGWIRVDLLNPKPEDKWFAEGFHNTCVYSEEGVLLAVPCDGTWELIGPKVQGNPYELEKHYLDKHGTSIINPPPPRDFEGLREWLGEHEIEGIVWHHPDGRMVKIKRKDFGYKWPCAQVHFSVVSK